MDPQWTVKLVVRDWHVSFIRAFFIPDQIMVDISFNNGLAVENSEMLSHLFDVQPDAAKFCLLMKRWIETYGGEMKGYSLVLLVIFFLQQRNLFPTIKTVQKGLRKLYIEGNVGTFVIHKS
jgi:DNA polymerase sigma